jgi:hypothetical protein
VNPIRAQTYGPPGGAVAGQVGTSGVDAYPGDGIRLSESALLHLGITAEAGYDTNVFYASDKTPSNQVAQSAVLVVSPFFDISNATRHGGVTQAFTYHLGASLAYRQYVDDDPNVKAQSHFSPSASAGIAVTGAKTSFSLSDAFTRLQEAPYGVLANGMQLDGPETIKRDHNTASAQVGLSPGGGRITTTLRYTNRLELFEKESETDLSWGDNMGHEGMLDVAWKWLPKTALFLRANAGYIHFFNTDNDPAHRRTDSFPVSGGLGIRGLITPKLSSSIDLGYGTAFYPDKSLTVSGGSSVQGTVSLAYRLGFATALSLGYAHGFRNSALVGDYYDLDGVQIGASQSLGGRLVASLDGRWEYRRYQNVPLGTGFRTRKDHLAMGQAKIDFYIQRWLYAGVGYTVTWNSSDLDNVINQGMPAGMPATIQGIDYLKHQILGRLGVTY